MFTFDNAHQTSVLHEASMAVGHSESAMDTMAGLST